MVLAFAAAAPFTGVPPLGVSGAGTEPGTVSITVAPHGELTVEPKQEALPPTPIRSAADPKGPTLKLSVTNSAWRPAKISVRLTPTVAALGDAVEVRGSVARTVVFDGPLVATEAWSPFTVKAIAPGETSIFRIRLSLREGVAPEEWLGRADVRLLEFQTQFVDDPAATTPVPGATTPESGATSPTEPTTPTTPGPGR